MFTPLKKVPNYKKVDPKIVNELIDRINVLSKITTGGGITVQTSPMGIHLHGRSSTTIGQGKVFEIQSAATGDGVYNCYEQTLDATEWEDTDGDHKTDDLNETSVEVLNLMEYDPAATYKEALALGDLIKAWKWTDDEGTVRWCGIPLAGGFVRGAITTQAAPADTKITANLYNHAGVEITEDLGSGIDVYCDITGGANLNAALPYLADAQPIPVYNDGGKWWCTTIFQKMDICT